ncbi:MAG: plasmid recombination protein [Oscillospiraceae bacterium]|nr:plasmid recombination protein [Oscillospiraceae bacterium]
MKRTISVMVGKGSVNHNRRKFIAENVDVDRTDRNIEYCYTPIKQVYHEMFDEALKRYNEKQTRADRRIDDYYEKIRSGKQEKPFHEVIIQVGNCEDMNATGENAELAKTVLDEYYAGFQQRNPYLNVFSAHLHMDEGTPHLHIDFIPFTTGSKRGLDTRVSLKQALANEGFVGKGKGETEWAVWVRSEKEQLAEIMQSHGIEWEQKGEHREHLSVLEYKREQRVQELAELTEQTQQKEAETAALDKQIEKTKQKKVNIDSINKIEVKPVMLSSSRVSLDRKDYETLSTAAKKFYAQEKKELKLQKALDSANKTVGELKAENSSLKDELFKYKSVRNKLNAKELEKENERLRGKVRMYEDAISRNGLWELFTRERTSGRENYETR